MRLKTKTKTCKGAHLSEEYSRLKICNLYFRYFSSKNKTAKLDRLFWCIFSDACFASSYCVNQRFFLALLIHLIKHLKDIFSKNKEKLKLQTSQKCSFGILNLKQIEKMIWRAFESIQHFPNNVQ